MPLNKVDWPWNKIDKTEANLQQKRRKDCLSLIKLVVWIPKTRRIATSWCYHFYHQYQFLFRGEVRTQQIFSEEIGSLATLDFDRSKTDTDFSNLQQGRRVVFVFSARKIISSIRNNNVPWKKCFNEQINARAVLLTLNYTYVSTSSSEWEHLLIGEIQY